MTVIKHGNKAGEQDETFDPRVYLTTQQGYSTRDIEVSADCRTYYIALAQRTNVRLVALDVAGKPVVNFGGGQGYVEVEHGQYYDDVVRLQRIGDDILVGRLSRVGNIDCIVCSLYTPGGTLKASFGQGGHAVINAPLVTSMPDSKRNSVARVESQLFDMVVAGERIHVVASVIRGGKSTPLVVRLTLDGQTDKAFGQSGLLEVATPVDVEWTAERLAVSSEGIYIAVQEEYETAGLLALDLAGNPLASFGREGYVRLAPLRAVYALACDDTRVYVAGTDWDFAFVQAFELSTGVRAYNFQSFKLFSNVYAVSTDRNTLIIVGEHDENDTNQIRMFVARLDDEGELDVSFGEGGYVEPDLAKSLALGVRVVEQQAIVIADTFLESDRRYDPHAFRFFL